MPKNLIDDLASAAPNRRNFLKKIGAATAAVSALSVAGVKSAEAQTTTELSVLQFALNLEYAEAEFYSYGLTGAGIESFGIAINGLANGSNPTSGGTTTGGMKVDFTNAPAGMMDILTQIASDERAHVALIRSALGGQAIAKPNINLYAYSSGFRDMYEFLRIGRLLEDVGVSAYGGAIGLLTTPLFITNTGRVLAAEAEHVSALRVLGVQLKITSPFVDAADLTPPPTGPAAVPLSVNPANGLTAVRTPGQVLYLAFGQIANVSQGGFFPTGVNGPFTTSSAPATAANLGTTPPA
jgi:hypothetical protein